jgi:hypothetical protein
MTWVDVPGEMLMEPRVTMNDFLKSVKNRSVLTSFVLLFSLSSADDEDDADDGGCDVVVVLLQQTDGEHGRAAEANQVHGGVWPGGLTSYCCPAPSSLYPDTVIY